MNATFVSSLNATWIFCFAEEGGSYPFSEWLRFIVMIVNFVVFICMLVWFGKKPVSAAIKARREQFLEDLKKAKEAREEAERLLAEANDKLAKADQEARDLVRDFQRRAQLMADEIIKSAERSAQKILDEAKSAAQSEVDKIFAAVRREITRRAIAEAEKILRERMSFELDRRLVDQAIENIGKDDRQ